MRTTALRALLAAAVAATATSAGAFDWRGRIGLLYSRDDVLSPAPSQTTPYLQIDLGLDASGYVYHPAFLTYTGSVGYRRATTSPQGQGEILRETLDYRLRVKLLGHVRSPVSLSLHASQQEEDYSGSAPQVLEYSRESRTYGADLRLARPGGRLLEVGYSRTEETQSVPTLPDEERTVDSIYASTSQGSTNFSYTARYRGKFSEGTYDSDDHDEHRVDVVARARVEQDTHLDIRDGYYRRVPTAVSPFNPSQEANTLQASVRYRPSMTDFHTVRYAYLHGLQSAPATPDLERVQHHLGYEAQRTLGPEWRLAGSAGATLSQDRVGGAETSAAGQSLGLTAGWRRTLPRATVDVRGGTSVGIVEPAGGSLDWGYGVSAGVQYTRAARVGWQLTYDATYVNGLGVPGWTLRQVAGLSADTALGTALVRGQLTGSAERRESPTVGSGGIRALNATVTYTLYRFNATLGAGVSSGITAPVPDLGTGDGLFLGLPYDTHTYFAFTSAGYNLTRSLRLNGTLRLTSSVLPDRPGRDELEARARVEYGFGGLSLGVEEQYNTVTVEGSSFAYSRFLVTASRVFGSRW